MGSVSAVDGILHMGSNSLKRPRPNRGESLVNPLVKIPLLRLCSLLPLPRQKRK